MLKPSKSNGQIDQAVGQAAKRRDSQKSRSAAACPTAADDRSTGPGSSETVGKQDRRRLCGTSPNSRQSRRRPAPATSSHLQDRDLSMGGTFSSFVGIDVAKHSLDVCVLPDDKRFSLANDHGALKRLQAELPT